MRKLMGLIVLMLVLGSANIGVLTTKAQAEKTVQVKEQAAFKACPNKANRVIVLRNKTWELQDKQSKSRYLSSYNSHHAGCKYTKWVITLWTTRYHQEKQSYAQQYDWQKWLPDKWRRVGTCETGLNWNHHNSSYVSAFGIQRGAKDGMYDYDAAQVGMPPWNDNHPPTPWQQYQTGLSHYIHHGGFSGWGCKNA